MRYTQILVAAAAAFSSSPIVAQDVRGGTEPAPIVVQGQRDSDAEIRELVNALPTATADDHLSRFEHSACPAVLGVSPAQRVAMANRMRAVGTAAGVPMGSEHCVPNVVVLVTANKRALIEQLGRRYPNLLGDLSVHRIATLARSPEPTALWHLNGLVDSDGRALPNDGSDVLQLRTVRPASRLADEAHVEFIGSVLVIEARAVVGLTPMQLADYAAMRTFTGADPNRLPNHTLPTILTVLGAPMGSEVPISLTQWDLAFLRSFYASNANFRSAEQRSEIRAGMHHGLGGTPEGEARP